MVLFLRRLGRCSSRLRRTSLSRLLENKKISNDQELIQSDPTKSDSAGLVVAAVLSIKLHQFSLCVRHPGEFNGRSIHTSLSTTRTFYFKEQLYFPLFEIFSEWLMGKWVARSTWRLFLLKGFLDTKWFQAMMKDYMNDNIFFWRIVLSWQQKQYNIFLKQIICISCLGSNLIDQIIKICMSGHKDEFY